MEKWKLVVAVMAVLLVGIQAAEAGVTVVDFENIPGLEFPPVIPNGYAGLNWDNFGALNVYKYAEIEYPLSGYLNGVVSGERVAVNHYADVAAVSGSAFTFKGAYFTAAWNNGLNINIKGYNTGSLLQETTITVNTDGPTWFDFDWTGVDNVVFNSYGGTHNPGFDGYGTHFAMDNFTCEITAVPAPGALLLGCIGCGCISWIKKRKTL